MLGGETRGALVDLVVSQVSNSGVYVRLCLEVFPVIPSLWRELLGKPRGTNFTPLV